MTVSIDAMKCATCETPVVMLRMGGVCPLDDAAVRCPHLVSPPAYHRGDMTADQWCELTDNIDMGDQ